MLNCSWKLAAGNNRDPEGNIRYEQTGLSADFKASLKDQLSWLLGEAAGKR